MFPQTSFGIEVFQTSSSRIDDLTCLSSQDLVEFRFQRTYSSLSFCHSFTKMACTGFRHPLRCLLREGHSQQEVLGFLVPSLSKATTKRSFSSSSSHLSRVGMAPISIPTDVSLRFFDLPKAAKSRHVDAPASAVEITGPQGTRKNTNRTVYCH